MSPRRLEERRLWKAVLNVIISTGGDPQRIREHFDRLREMARNLMREMEEKARRGEQVTMQEAGLFAVASPYYYIGVARKMLKELDKAEQLATSILTTLQQTRRLEKTWLLWKARKLGLVRLLRKAHQIATRNAIQLSLIK